MKKFAAEEERRKYEDQKAKCGDKPSTLAMLQFTYLSISFVRKVSVIYFGGGDRGTYLASWGRGLKRAREG